MWRVWLRLRTAHVPARNPVSASSCHFLALFQSNVGRGRGEQKLWRISPTRRNFFFSILSVWRFFLGGIEKQLRSGALVVRSRRWSAGDDNALQYLLALLPFRVCLKGVSFFFFSFRDNVFSFALGGFCGFSTLFVLEGCFFRKRLLHADSGVICRTSPFPCQGDRTASGALTFWEMDASGRKLGQTSLWEFWCQYCSQ